MPSESVENYLSEILRLEEAESAASTSALADRLQVAQPSVTGMLRRLAEDRLVRYEPYRGARLTGPGRRRARALLRRHRLVETFLVRALGMAPTASTTRPTAGSTRWATTPSSASTAGWASRRSIRTARPSPAPPRRGAPGSG